MSYFPDLSPYGRRGGAEKTLNIGWLDIAHAYPSGDVPGPFLERLWAFCRVAVDPSRGFHPCEFCGAAWRQTHVVQRGEEILRLGSCEIRVFGRDGTIYAAPNLVYHYVVHHQYCPPDAFIQAVLQGPQPGSDEYQTLLSQHDRPVGATPSLSFVPITLEQAVIMKPPPAPLSVGEPLVDHDGFVSGGLGLSQETWERVHTQSNMRASYLADPDRLYYDDDRFSVHFQDGYIETLVWRDDGNPLTLDKARTKSVTLIPKDSRFIRTYSDHDFIVDLYLSKALKNRFESDVWAGGEPGNFIVRHLDYFGRVPIILIATGNELW